MTIREAYLKMQDECGLKEGDRVRVLRKAKTDELGWCCGWEEYMENSVGEEFLILGIWGSQGINLDNDFSYPWFVLELVDGVDEPVEMTVVEVSETLGYEIKIVKG